MAFPVCCYPVTESGPIQPELTRNLSDRAGCLDHHLGGFLLKLRREITAFVPCHLIPSFPAKILLDPRPESSGHSTPHRAIGGICVQSCAAPVEAEYAGGAEELGSLTEPRQRVL